MLESQARWFLERTWRLRNLVTASPPVCRNLQPLEVHLRRLSHTQQAAATALMARYDLSHWEKICDQQGFQESLYVLDVLDQVGQTPCFTHRRGLDVGCKNGCYLPGLHAWSGAGWDGVELDAHRRYWTFTTRRAHGEWVAARLPDCRYFAKNILSMTGLYGHITWFLPFLHTAPLRAWGLPDEFLMPQTLLAHVWTLLAPGGRLFIVNQGKTEARLQSALFNQLQIDVQRLGQIDSLLSPFRCPRYGFLAQKKPP